ncbi:protein kinase [Geodermatophilus sp. SYSU D00691]
MEIGTGSTVGGYRIERTLGQGGMGAVYLARHPTLPRQVALKVLHPAFSSHPEFRERFEREADLLCALEHPNVVDVLDRGQDGDLLYIVMRYVAGPDLHTALHQRGPFPPAQAVEVVAAVGRALDHAHARGLLHRDVKPANILLKPLGDGTEEAVLTDFGIAKDVTAVAPLTRDGQVPATVAYASPEQINGWPADGRADVYSLGTVLFELLTGRRAFPAEDMTPLLASVLVGPVPDARQVRTDLPPALAEVVARALAKDPGERFATCAELVAAARAALTPRSAVPPTTVGATGAPPPPPPLPTPVTRSQTVPAPAPAPRRHRWPVAVALLALVAVAAIVVGVVLTGGNGGDDGGDPGTTAQGPTSSTGATAPPVDGFAVGDCLDAGRQATTCDGEHAAEVYSTTDCTADALLAYLGGEPGRDVLRTNLQTAQVGAACTVGLPGATLDGPNQRVLDDRDGDVWRRCLDGATELPCSERHTAEVVFEQAQSTDPLACTSRADDYLGAPFSRHDDVLRVREAGTTCLIEVRGADELTASLRDLRSNALPLD